MKNLICVKIWRRCTKERGTKNKKVVAYHKKGCNTMTQREFFEKAIKIFESDSVKDNVMADFAKERIEALDRRNTNRSSKLTKTQIENEKIKEKIMALFDEHNNLAACEVAEKIEISTQKASALLVQLEKAKQKRAT